MAPTERNMSTSVMPHVMSVVLLSNSSASSETVSDTVKKSKASQDQAMKATAKLSHCILLSWRSAVNGFGSFSMGGLSVVTRDTRYSPALILLSMSACASGDGDMATYWLVGVLAMAATSCSDSDRCGGGGELDAVGLGAGRQKEK